MHESFSPNRVLPALSKLQICSLAKITHALVLYPCSGMFKCLCVITLEGALVREVGGIACYHQHRFHATYNFQENNVRWECSQIIVSQAGAAPPVRLVRLWPDHFSSRPDITCTCRHTWHMAHGRPPRGSVLDCSYMQLHCRLTQQWHLRDHTSQGLFPFQNSRLERRILPIDRFKQVGSARGRGCITMKSTIPYCVICARKR